MGEEKEDENESWIPLQGDAPMGSNPCSHYITACLLLNNSRFRQPGITARPRERPSGTTWNSQTRRDRAGKVPDVLFATDRPGSVRRSVGLNQHPPGHAEDERLVE